jgi:hypothetical protein
VIVRSDLPRGVQAAQIAHAAGESSPGGLASGTYAVVLGVTDEATLASVCVRLEAAGIASVKIYEPDAPFHGALMAVGVVPRKKSEVQRTLSSLPLLR